MRSNTRSIIYIATALATVLLAAALSLVFTSPEIVVAAAVCHQDELKPCFEKLLARALPNAKLAGAVRLGLAPSLSPLGLTATLSVDDVEFHHPSDTDKVVHVTSVLIQATRFRIHASSHGAISFQTAVDVSLKAANATANFGGTLSFPFRGIVSSMDLQADGALVIGTKTLTETLAALHFPPQPWLDSNQQDFDFRADLSVHHRNKHPEQTKLALKNVALGLGSNRAKGALVIDDHSAMAELNIESLDLDTPSNRRAPFSLDKLFEKSIAGLKSFPGHEVLVKLSVEKIHHKNQIARMSEFIGRRDRTGAISLPNLALELPGGTTAKLVVDRLNDEAKFRPSGSLSVVSNDLAAALSWLDIQPENLPEKRLKAFDLHAQVQSNGDRIELNDLRLNVDGSTGGGNATLLPAPASSASGEFVQGEAHLKFDKINLIDYVPRGDQKRSKALPDEAIATAATLSINFNVKAAKPHVELTKVEIEAGDLSLRFPELAPKRLKDLPLDHRFLPQELAAQIANRAADLQSYQTPEAVEHLIGAAEAGEQFLSVLSWRDIVIKAPMEVNLRFGRLAVRSNFSEGRDNDRSLAELSGVSIHTDLTAPVGQPDGTKLQSVRLDLKSAHAYLSDWDFSQIELHPELAFRLDNGSAKFAGAKLTHTAIRGSAIDVARSTSKPGILGTSNQPRRMDFGMAVSLEAFPDHMALNIKSLSVGDILNEKNVAVTIDWDKSSPRNYVLRARNKEAAPTLQRTIRRPVDVSAAEPSADRCHVAQPEVRGDATFKFDIDVDAALDVKPAPMVRRLVLNGGVGPNGARIEQLAIDLGQRSRVRARLTAKANHEASSIGGCLFVGLATKADFDTFEAFAARTNDKDVVALAHVYDGDMSTTLVGQIQRDQNELIGLGAVDVTLGDVSSANRQKAAVARGKATLSGGFVMDRAGQLDLLHPSAARTSRFGAVLSRSVDAHPNSLEVVFPQCPKGSCLPLSVTLLKASSTFPAGKLANKPFEARLYEMSLRVGEITTNVRSLSNVPLVTFDVTTSPVPTIRATLALETLSEKDVDALRKLNEALPAHGQFDFDTNVSIKGIDASLLFRLFGMSPGQGQLSGRLTDIRVHLNGKQARVAAAQGSNVPPRLAQQSIEFDASALVGVTGSGSAFPRCSPEPQQFIPWSPDERLFAARSKDGTFRLSGKLDRVATGWSGGVSGNAACIDVAALIRLLNQAGLADTRLLQEVEQARLDALSFQAAIPELGAVRLLENLANFSGRVRWSGRFALKKERRIWYVEGASGVDLWAPTGIPVSGSLDLLNGSISGFIQSTDPVVLDEARPAVERQLPSLHPAIVRMVARETLPGPKVQFVGRVRSPRWHTPIGTCDFREIPTYIQDFGFMLDMRTLKTVHSISPALQAEGKYCEAMRPGEWLPVSP